MNNILELLQGETGRTLLNGTAQETNQPANKTGELLSLALPVLMGAMRRNANSSGGAEGLLNALNDRHDGSVLDNLGTLFEGGYTRETFAEGEGILSHVLGNKQEGVASALGSRVGMDTGDVMNILKMVAPIVMGYLGKQQRSQGVNSPNDLGDLLGGLLGGGQSQNQQGLIEAFLDSDGDGSAMDDLVGMFLKDKKQGGLGDLLGGFLGKQ